MGPPPCVVLIAALVAGIAAVQVAAPPSIAVAVANRDAEGAVVVDADATRNYLPTAASCRDACVKKQGCNLWVWCGAVSGCTSGGSGSRDPSRFQQCWLKYDIPPGSDVAGPGRFPRPKNLPDQGTGWLSGTTLPGLSDGAPTPERAYSCTCQSNYTSAGFLFQGVCAKIGDNYDSACFVDTNCRNPPNDGIQSCSSVQPCTVLLDTDLKEDKVLVSGDGNTADSAEDCCGQCAKTKGCNVWAWCSDARGCGGDIFRFRQCWLKQANPLTPNPKAGFGGSPGWVSGVRLAWLPA